MTSHRRRKTGQAKPAAPSPLVINGWTFLAWPAFDERWQRLLTAVIAQRRASPNGPLSSPEATLLAALVRVVRDQIARDPKAPDFRLKRDLGAWRRAKFLGRLRLFFRFNTEHRVVILTWLNDEHSLRKEGSSTDPYNVFAGMLSRGEVPAGWAELLANAVPMGSPLPDADRRRE